MSRTQIILIIAGVLILFTGYQEAQLAGLAKEIPQELTLAELEENGPGDNAHLIVSDFVLCDWNFVYVKRRGRATEVWVPAVPLYGDYFQGIVEHTDETGNFPADFEYPALEDVRVLVKLTSVSNREELAAIAIQNTMQGVVISEVESLGSGEAEFLASKYPDVDFETCLIFEHGREPTTSGALTLFFAGGGLLVLLGTGLWLRSRRRDAEVSTYDEEGEFEDGVEDPEDGEALDAAR